MAHAEGLWERAAHTRTNEKVVTVIGLFTDLYLPNLMKLICSHKLLVWNGLIAAEDPTGTVGFCPCSPIHRVGRPRPPLQSIMNPLRPEAAGAASGMLQR